MAKFSNRKAAEAAAVLLREMGGAASPFRLIKLMYLAERASLAARERTILGDDFHALPHGPVPSRFCDLARGKVRTRAWDQCIARKGTHTLRLVKFPPLRELDDYEADLLRDVVRDLAPLDDDDLHDHMHALPEWRNPAGSRVLITPQAIMDAIDQEDAASARQALASEERIPHEEIRRRLAARRSVGSRG